MLCPVGNPRSAWVSRCQFDIVLLRLSLFSSFFAFGYFFLYIFFSFCSIDKYVFFLSRLFTVWSVHFNRFGFGFSILMVFVRSFANEIVFGFVSPIEFVFVFRLLCFFLCVCFNIANSNSYYEILFGCSYSTIQNVCMCVLCFANSFIDSHQNQSKRKQMWGIGSKKRMMYEIKETNFFLDEETAK